LLAASEMDGVTYVWNLDSGSRISLDDPDGSIIESVAFSPNGKWLATGDATGNTDLWNLTTNKNKPAETLANPKGPAPSLAGNAVFSEAFGPDSSTLATTDTNGHIYLWTVP
jgi:WD40 repeat protein